MTENNPVCSATIWTSPEAAVFRSQYTELKAAIQSPEIVADELFASGSIDSGIKEKVHLQTCTRSDNCEVLLNAIGQKIYLDPNEFYVLISVLRKEPATKEVADRLLKSCRKLSVKSVCGSSYKGSCSLVAVAALLLLLSVVVMWKLELSLPPYTVTAGIGALSLAVVIRKYWVTQRALTDAEHRKIENQQHSKVHSEKGQRSNDSTNTLFNLPQYIRMMISNYQQLQKVVAIGDVECHTRKIKEDEQFSPIVTIVDTATQQILDCVLLLHGEKPLEASRCGTMFYYIAVQVTVISYHDAHDSYSHPLYHMESKPCKQGRLPLTFYFYQAGTVCVIQLSIHSIVDSEGVEYMYHSEDCNCIVRIIDRKQHHGHSRTKHGVERVKEPPLLRYTGPLATKRHHKLQRIFTTLFLTNDFEQIDQLSELVILSRGISTDIKVFALCWAALSVAVYKNYVCAEKLLKTAWKKASKLDCENGLLLQGKVLKHFAFMNYAQHNDKKALVYISAAKERLFNAAPSNERAFALYTALLVKKRTLFSNCTFSSQEYESTERQYELLLEHATHMEDYEKPFNCNFLSMKASFHLRSALITADKLPSEEYCPSPDDLRKAEECLKYVSLHIMPIQSKFYTARYYCTLCDLCVWNQQYPEAMYYLEKARELQMEIKATMHYFDEQLKLLQRLQGDNKIDEILKGYSDV